MKKILFIIVLVTLLSFNLFSIVFAETVEVKLTNEDIVDNTDKTIDELDKLMPLSDELFEWATGDSGTVYSYTTDDKESILFILLEEQELILYPITFEGINKDKAVKLVLSDGEDQEEQQEIEQSKDESSSDKNEKDEDKKSVEGSTKSDGQDQNDESSQGQASNTDVDDISNSETSTQAGQGNQENSNEAVTANNDNLENANDKNNDTNNETAAEEPNASDTLKENKSNMLWIVIPVVFVICLAVLVLRRKR